MRVLRKQEREFAQVNFGNFLALYRGCWGPIGGAGENYVIISRLSLGWMAFEREIVVTE